MAAPALLPNRSEAGGTVPPSDACTALLSCATVSFGLKDSVRV